MSYDVLPQLLDPPITVDQSDLQVISRIARELHGRHGLRSRRCKPYESWKVVLQKKEFHGSEQFVIGDFAPGNVMVKLCPDQQFRRHRLFDSGFSQDRHARR